MSKHPVHFRFGAQRTARRDKSGEIHFDEGDDGLFVDPKRRIFAVADGVGSVEGKGHIYLSYFEALLERHAMNFREAFDELLGKNLSATFVGLQLPEFFDEKATLLDIGDSSCLRLRVHKTRGTVLELLSDIHTLGEDLKRQGIDIKKPPVDFDDEWIRSVHHIVSAYLRDSQQEKKLVEIEKSFTYFYRHTDVERKRREFLEFLKGNAAKISVSLNKPAVYVESRIGAGKSLSVQPGDVFVLHTDGINVNRKLMKAVVAHEDPLQASRTLLTSSTIGDDRTVIVVELGNKPFPGKQGKGIIRDSIR